MKKFFSLVLVLLLASCVNMPKTGQGAAISRATSGLVLPGLYIICLKGGGPTECGQYSFYDTLTFRDDGTGHLIKTVGDDGELYLDYFTWTYVTNQPGHIVATITSDKTPYNPNKLPKEQSPALYAKGTKFKGQTLAPGVVALNNRYYYLKK